MKILIVLSLLLAQFQSAFTQDSLQSEAITIIKIVDSVIGSINSTPLNEKIVHGSVEPFSAVSGIAFLNRESTEIKKLQLTSLSTQAVITYYCINNIIRMITTSQALYYRYNNKWLVFHFLKDIELLSHKQLQSQDEFLKNAIMILRK